MKNPPTYIFVRLSKNKVARCVLTGMSNSVELGGVPEYKIDIEAVGSAAIVQMMRETEIDNRGK